MDVDWLYKVILLTVTLIFSAFFSGSEVALFSLEKKKIKKIKEERTLINSYISQLLEAPRRLLVTILLGNTIFNVAASILSVTLAIDFANAFGYSLDLILLFQIILLTILILMIGEVTPKVIASKFPYQFARVISIPLYWTSVLFYPVAKIITDLLKSLASKVRFDRTRTAILSSELSDLAEIGAEKGTFEEGEHELIHGLVTFKTVTAREVMTPRVDIISLSVDATYDEVIRTITNSGHSRLPLYDDNLDNIIGVIYAKDLLPYLNGDDEKMVLNLRTISRKAMFIPESKLISDLMHEFQESNMHVGIVVDEYGGTSGLISLEDILEEIVGEIRDEYDREENEITKINDNSYLILGKVSIDELNNLLADNFASESDDYDTVGGFIYNQAASIPEEGYTFEFKNVRFTVKQIENKRINKVLVEKLPLTNNSDE